MSALGNIYIKLETLETMLKVVQKKGEKGISIDISISDETNQFEQNISSYVSQTKEQREEKKPRFYVGNGKVFWTDGKISVVTKKDSTKVEHGAQQQDDDITDDLPF